MKRISLFSFLLAISVMVYSCNNGAYDANPGAFAGAPTNSTPFNNNGNLFSATIDTVPFTALTAGLVKIAGVPVISATDGKTTFYVTLTSVFSDSTAPDTSKIKYPKGIYYINSANTASYFTAADPKNIHTAIKGQVEVVSNSSTYVEGYFDFIMADSIKVNAGHLRATE